MLGVVVVCEATEALVMKRGQNERMGKGTRSILSHQLQGDNTKICNILAHFYDINVK